MFKPLLRSLALILLTGLRRLRATGAPPQKAATPQPSLAPSAVGVSAQRLQRLHDGMKGFVDRNEAAGIVTLIMREGRMVDIHATGFQDKESKTPMRTTTMFRIASMTKPITSVAVMMLYEEGKLFLTDPVSKFIPAFKGQQVLEQGADKPVPARRADEPPRSAVASLRHHLRFLQRRAVGNSYRKNGVTDGLTTTTMTLAEGIDKLAAEPLVAQPGTAFNYSLSTDVLGRVVEVASGQSFDVFLRERIFKPLKMIDTDFVVPEAKWSRLATVYSPDGSGGIAR